MSTALIRLAIFMLIFFCSCGCVKNKQFVVSAKYKAFTVTTDGQNTNLVVDLDR